jgi:phosphatidylglycerol:prolipoprotein diacylglycerol transferase
MLPELFRIGPLTVHSFGFMLALSFLLIAWLAAKEFVRRGYSTDDAWSCTLGAMVGGVLGAKIYFLIDHWSETLADPSDMIFSGAGLTYYGGLIGGALGVLYVIYKRRLSLPVVADMGAPLIALGYGLGRVGCFLNGCDYGCPADVPWAMAFPRGSPPTEVAVHPTQVYEVSVSLAYFFFLWANRRRWETRTGFSFALYLVLAGVERFLVEFVRLNDPVALGLTMAQWISLGLVVLGAFLITRTRTR